LTEKGFQFVASYTRVAGKLFN